MLRIEQSFRYARAALDRSAWTIESLRARLGSAEKAGSSRQRLALRGVLYDLGKRRDFLRALHAEVAACPAEAFAERWRAFQEGYDDFLEAARAGRRELDRADREDPVAPTPRGVDCTQR